MWEEWEEGRRREDRMWHYSRITTDVHCILREDYSACCIVLRHRR